MEVEVVAGSYDCAIRGLSFDVLAPGEKVSTPINGLTVSVLSIALQ